LLLLIIYSSQAYTNPDLDFVLVSNRDFLNWFLSLLTFNVIILTAWTAVAPLEFVREYEQQEVDEFGRQYESFGACTNPDALPYGAVLLSSNIVIVCIGNWWAWQTRNIETEYKESRYVNLSLAFTLQAWLLGIPIMGVVWKNADARYYVSLGVVVITSVASLATIYVPKMIAIRGDRKLKADGEKRESYLQFAERKKELDVRNDRGYDSDERKETDSLPREIMTTAIREETREEAEESSTLEVDRHLLLTKSTDIWVDIAESEEKEISENSAATNSMYAEKSNSSIMDGLQKVDSIDLDDIGLSEEEVEDGDGFGEIAEQSSSRMHEVHDSRKNRDKSKARSSMLGSLGASFAFRSPSFAIQSKEADPQMGGIKIKFNPRVSILYDSMFP
jgi:hypothetical protein